MVARVFICFLWLGVHTAFAVSPDIPRHYEFRQAMYQNLADEIVNTATKQDVVLYRNEVLSTIQSTLNPVLDEVLVRAGNFEPCNSTNDECVNAQWNSLGNPLTVAEEKNNFLAFYHFQVYVWTKLYISPKHGWTNLNNWYEKYIAHTFNLKGDTLQDQHTNNLFLNTRVMYYRLKEELFPQAEHVSKSLFTAYYNHCVYVLKQPSIISYEFEGKALEIDSIMQIAVQVKSVKPNAELLNDAANVYIAAAFNDQFPMGIGKEDLISMFYISHNLLHRALDLYETGKVHYAIGALYNNFLIDYGNMFTTPEKLDLFGKSIVPSELMESSVDHLEKACELDPEYCNLRKLRVKR